MPQIAGVDHVVITVENIDAACTFYEQLFGARIVQERTGNGRALVRKVAVGGALLSIHQVGNGVELVAKRPTTGAADICLRWDGSIEDAVALLTGHEIAVIAGPVPRQTADGLSSQSVYFRDPDGNLLELMAADRN
jgi:catechol 2,3-dioxygenase-like lactoylglutathione lyase family enzyme